MFRTINQLQIAEIFFFKPKKYTNYIQTLEKATRRKYTNFASINTFDVGFWRVTKYIPLVLQNKNVQLIIYNYFVKTFSVLISKTNRQFTNKTYTNKKGRYEEGPWPISKKSTNKTRRSEEGPWPISPGNLY